jgi:hypothetical protein
LSDITDSFNGLGPDGFSTNIPMDNPLIASERIALSDSIGNAESASAVLDSQYGTPLDQNASLNEFVQDE